MVTDYFEWVYETQAWEDQGDRNQMQTSAVLRLLGASIRDIIVIIFYGCRMHNKKFDTHKVQQSVLMTNHSRFFHNGIGMVL